MEGRKWSSLGLLRQMGQSRRISEAWSERRAGTEALGAQEACRGQRCE